MLDAILSKQPLRLTCVAMIGSQLEFSLPLPWPRVYVLDNFHHTSPKSPDLGLFAPLQLRHEMEGRTVCQVLTPELCEILACNRDCLRGLKLKRSLWGDLAFLGTQGADHHWSEPLNKLD